jgi:hypothetical protein
MASNDVKRHTHDVKQPQALLTMLGNRDPFRDGEEYGPVLSLLETRSYDVVRHTRGRGEGAGA